MPRRAATAVLGKFSMGELLRRFHRDESGSYLIIATLLMPVLLGLVGLGTDAGLWMYKHRAMQSAADAGAYSAATAFVKDTESGETISHGMIESQARAVTATYDFVHGTSDVSVTVNWPYGGDQKKVEVIVEQPQIPLFYGPFKKLVSSAASDSVVVKARALAAGTPGIPGTSGTPGQAGNGCVVALNKTASGALTTQGTSNVALSGCSIMVNSNSSTALSAGGNSTINVSNPQSTDKGFVGVVGGVSAASQTHINVAPTTIATVTDPYAGVPNPVFSNGKWTLGDLISGQGCDLTAYSPGKGSFTIGPTNPDTLFVICGGMTLNAGVTLTLTPGIYIFDQGVVQINGGATLIGTAVTLVFTSHTTSNYATATFNGGATIQLTAPTSGPTKGLVVYGDRNIPIGSTFRFNGGSSQVLNGAIYVPTGTVLFAGGSQTSNACTQLVADRVTFTGNSNFKIGCSNGTVAVGGTQGTPETPGTPETVLLTE